MRGEFCGYCLQGLPLPLLRGLVFKGSPGPRFSGPKSLSATPTPPPGPSPCSHFLIWVYHTGRKRRNFSLQAGLGGGVSPSPRGAGAPLYGTPVTSGHAPSPSPQLPRLPAPPSRKGAESSRPPACLGRSSKAAQAGGGKALGKEGPRGQRRGRCVNEGEVQDSSQSRRWERGLWEAPGAGQVKGGGEGESGSIGVQSPDAKEWRAKFPRGGGTWGGHSLH